MTFSCWVMFGKRAMFEKKPLYIKNNEAEDLFFGCTAAFCTECHVSFFTWHISVKKDPPVTPNMFLENQWLEDVFSF